MNNTFTVFKEASGRLRWLAISSNGYQDRDGEILSAKALADDVARRDVDGLHGPLRWWHIGEPNPLDFKAPWGQGLDLGQCDWADVHDGFLVESGTFYDDEVGAALAAKAADLELSLGFFHPTTAPDGRGVFKQIRSFERSLAPKGRVSNLLTGFYVPTYKEPRMNQAKMKALADLLDVSVEEVKALYAGQTSTRKKTAQALGLRFKAPGEELAEDEEAALGEVAVMSLAELEEFVRGIVEGALAEMKEAAGAPTPAKPKKAPAAEVPTAMALAAKQRRYRNAGDKIAVLMGLA